jgi:transcriptional regulator of acetoin/glycerol metabolism
MRQSDDQRDGAARCRQGIRSRSRKKTRTAQERFSDHDLRGCGSTRYLSFDDHRTVGKMIKIALREHRGKVDAAAKALGISRKGL